MWTECLLDHTMAGERDGDAEGGDSDEVRGPIADDDDAMCSPTGFSCLIRSIK